MKINYFFLFLILVVLTSCQFAEKKTDKSKSDESKSTIIKSYFEKSRALKSEITVKNNKKNGPAKKYYPTGELHTIVYYVDNIKEGETVWYYKNGQSYRVTPYVKGKRHGIRKIYYENGKLQAEIPYQNGELVEGTKEYDKTGNLLDNQVKILFEEENMLKFEDKFILKMKLSIRSDQTEFFQEKTSTQGKKALAPIKTNLSGTGKIEYLLPGGAKKRISIRVYAKHKTKLGNPALISSSYNRLIENR